SRMKPRADNTRAAMNMSSWMCWCRQGPVAPQDSARSSAGANQWLPGPVGTGPGSRVYYVEERSPRGMPLIPGQIRSGILTTGVVAGVARRCGGTTCVEFLQLALEEGLQAGAVLALEHLELGDAGLQSVLLLLDGCHGLGVLALGISLQGVGLVLSLTDLGLSACGGIREGGSGLLLRLIDEVLGACLSLSDEVLGARLGVGDLLLSALTCSIEG